MISAMTLYVYLICLLAAANCHKVHNVEDNLPLPPPVPHVAQANQQQHHQQQHHQQQHQPVHPNGHAGSDQIMNNINKDHVLDHLDGIISKPKEQMSVDEQNFYYFKLHDYDNNNMLDGLELVSAFAHNEEHKDAHNDHSNKSDASSSTPPTTHAPPHPRITDDELIKLIDEIMKDEDKNLDGYITYQEFLHAIKA